MLYFVDEMDRYAPPEGVTIDKKKFAMLPEIHEVIEYGRHRGLSLGYTTRRAYRVHINLRAQTSTFRIYRTSEPTDLDYFARIMEPAAVRKIPHLQQYQYLEWMDDANIEPQVKGGRSTDRIRDSRTAQVINSQSVETRGRRILPFEEGRPLTRPLENSHEVKSGNEN